MKNNKKHRIVKITFGDKTTVYEVQKKSWFGKWANCMETYIDGMTLPVTYKTFEEAEKEYYCSFVPPIAEVIKEYE